MNVRLLIDEDLSPEYVKEMRRYNSAIDVLRVGTSGAPPLSTLDPDILLFCEREQRALVTENRATMARHGQDHLAAGHHHWGIFRFRKGYGMGLYLADLQLIWEASVAEEWIGQKPPAPFIASVDALIVMGHTRWQPPLRPYSPGA